MPVDLQHDEEYVRLTLNGAVDLSNAADFKRALVEGVATSLGQIHIDLSSVTEIDITGVQLLWAASEAARVHGTAFTIVQPTDATVLHYMEECGLGLPANTAPSESTAATA